MELSTEVKNPFFIVFHDGTTMEITEKQNDYILEMSGQPNIKSCVVNNSFITLSSIAKILDGQEFYGQYPDKRPASHYNQFEENYSAEANQIRQPTTRARELMKGGFIEYHLGEGRTVEQAEEKWNDLQKAGSLFRMSKLVRQ